MIQLLLNKTTPHFQLLPMSKVDQSLLRIHEVTKTFYNHDIPVKSRRVIFFFFFFFFFLERQIKGLHI